MTILTPPSLLRDCPLRQLILERLRQELQKTYRRIVRMRTKPLSPEPRVELSCHDIDVVPSSSWVVFISAGMLEAAEDSMSCRRCGRTSMITISVSGTSPEFKKAMVKSISSPIRAESLPDLLHKASSARPSDSTRSIAMPWLEDVTSAC